jgi:hypothetical protein
MRAFLGPALVAATLAACQPPAARQPNPSQPIAEGRAVAIIARTLQEQGNPAAEGRDVQLANGKPLHADVVTVDQSIAIVYLTEQDLALLDAAADLPPRPASDDFWVTQGSGPDASAIILLLDASNYRYDDLAGEQHETTSIVAENRLTRDVRDFLVAAARHVRKR